MLEVLRKQEVVYCKTCLCVSHSVRATEKCKLASGLPTAHTLDRCVNLASPSILVEGNAERLCTRRRGLFVLLAEQSFASIA